MTYGASIKGRFIKRSLLSCSGNTFPLPNIQDHVGYAMPRTLDTFWTQENVSTKSESVKRLHETPNLIHPLACTLFFSPAVLPEKPDTKRPEDAHRRLYMGK